MTFFKALFRSPNGEARLAGKSQYGWELPFALQFVCESSICESSKWYCTALNL